MITIWRPGDTEKLNYRWENSWDCDSDDVLRANYLARKGYAVCIWEPSARADTLLMIMGCNQLWAGCGQVWALPSFEARGHARYVVDAAVVLLDRLSEGLGIHRYHTLIHPKLFENVKWIKLLGFTAESVFRSASPEKENLIMYAKLFLGGYHEQTKNARARLSSDVEQLFKMEWGFKFPSTERSQLQPCEHGCRRARGGLRIVEPKSG